MDDFKIWFGSGHILEVPGRGSNHRHGLPRGGGSWSATEVAEKSLAAFLCQTHCCRSSKEIKIPLQTSKNDPNLIIFDHFWPPRTQNRSFDPFGGQGTGCRPHSPSQSPSTSLPFHPSRQLVSRICNPFRVTRGRGNHLRRERGIKRDAKTYANFRWLSFDPMGSKMIDFGSFWPSGGSNWRSNWPFRGPNRLKAET